MVRIGQHFSLSLIALVAILLAKPVTFLHPRVAAPPEQPPQAPLVVSAPQRFMTRDLPSEPSDERPPYSITGSLHLVGNLRGIAGNPPESLFTDSAHHSLQFFHDSTRPTRDSTPVADTPQPKPYRKPVPILMDHYIRPLPGPDDPIGRALSVEPAEFAAQIHWLSTHGYTPITLSELEAIRRGDQPAPAKPIVLTFDDGYRDFYEHAWPILRQYNFHATIFVITGLLDSPRYLTWEMVRELDRSGAIEIGAHTVHHVDLTQVSDAQLRAELTECATALREALGHPVLSFAYPTGKMDQRVKAATAAAGYRMAVTTQPGRAGADDDPLALPRLRVSGEMTLEQFAALLTVSN